MTEKVDYTHLADAMGETEGYEDIHMGTMAVPFIRIVQQLSPQLKKSKPEYIEDAEEGSIVNTILGKIYPEPLRLVVCKFEHLYIEWKPNRGGFVQVLHPSVVENDQQKYRMIADADGKMKLKDTATGNDIVETYTYYVLLPDHLEDGMCILSLTSTQLKEAKRLNRLLGTSRLPGTNKKALPHFMVWSMITVDMSKDNHDWVGIQFGFDQWVTPELLANARTEREELPNKTVNYAGLLEEDTTEDDTDEERF